MRLTRQKKNFLEGVATKIITSAPERVEPREAHYLACSPWQIMSFEAENHWKVKIAEEIYAKFVSLTFNEPLEIVYADDEAYSYRNKLEYSFVQTEGGKVELGFFERGGKYRRPIEPCMLGTDAINKTAVLILNWIREQKIPLRSLKSLIIRSNLQNETIAALFIKDHLPLGALPSLDKKFLGFQIYFSSPFSPASIPEEKLFGQGQDYLIEEVKGVKLKYGLLSFFQVNQPVFQSALADISAHLPAGADVIDYYSGVGSIGLPLAKNLGQLELVENNSEAVQYAEENIILNKLKNCRVELKSTEKMLELINSEKYIIVDPPRVGLHPDVIKKLVQALPPRIIYLSCDLATQARDIKELLPHFEPIFWRLYNFFPRTPHLEGLCVLERRSGDLPKGEK